MLTQQEKEEISAEFPRYEQKSAACIEALKIVQRNRGWVRDEDIQEVAKFLDMSPDEVDSVATFYNRIFRRPVGKHVIFVCESVSCWIMGCNEIFNQVNQRLKIKLGETSADGSFTLLPIACLGVCERAPALLVDNQVFHEVDSQRLNAIINQYDGSNDKASHLKLSG